MGMLDGVKQWAERQAAEHEARQWRDASGKVFARQGRDGVWRTIDGNHAWNGQQWKIVPRQITRSYNTVAAFQQDAARRARQGFHVVSQSTFTSRVQRRSWGKYRATYGVVAVYANV